MIQEEDPDKTLIIGGGVTIAKDEEVNVIGFEDLESAFKYKDYSMDPVEEHEAPFTSV